MYTSGSRNEAYQKAAWPHRFCPTSATLIPATVLRASKNMMIAVRTDMKGEVGSSEGRTSTLSRDPAMIEQGPASTGLLAPRIYPILTIGHI